MFLSIVTRHHPKRPEMFKKCLSSVDMQKDKDFEHIILLDKIGIGIAKANQMFYKYRKRVVGEYVFMLDDDDVFVTDTFVGDIKRIAKENNNPDIIFVRMLINDSVLPSEVVWEKDHLTKCHIGTSCFVMRNNLWQENIHNFASIPTTGDFHFINSVFQKKPTMYWQDKLYSKTLRVSRGQSE